MKAMYKVTNHTTLEIIETTSYKRVMEVLAEAVAFNSKVTCEVVSVEYDGDELITFKEDNL